MSAVCHFLLGWYILGCIPCGSWAWTVNMPSSIKAMLGSCVIIPCSFDYYKNPPSNPNRVVWYQYVSRGYPLVYDNWNSQSVIDKFKGKTSRVSTFSGDKECTLKISPVTWEHHRERIYPWIDPENVGWRTYKFYDKTVTIEVTDRAEMPEIMISGDMRVGQCVTVQCSVYHSCFTEPPTLSLNTPLQGHNLDTLSMANGTFKTTLMTQLNLVKDHQTVECTVQHTGGQRAKSSETFNAKSDPPKPKVTYAYEDPHYIVTCSFTHTCPTPSHRPNLTWSRDGEGEVSEMHRELHLGYWEVLSILTFMPKDKGNHSEVTCTAQFDGGRTSSTTMTVYIKRKESYRHIIIPAVVGIGTAAVFGVFCLFILKKYRGRISELQNQDGSAWNRLSRLSRRIRSSNPRPSCSDERTSRQRPKICNIQKVSKPRFPSPERLRSQQNSFSYKEDPGDDDYINTADLQIYGNL